MRTTLSRLLRGHTPGLTAMVNPTIHGAMRPIARAGDGGRI